MIYWKDGKEPRPVYLHAINRSNGWVWMSAHYLSRRQRSKACRRFNQEPSRYGKAVRVDARLKEINTNAHKLKGELAGVRKGTNELHKQLEQLRVKFFGADKKSK